MFCFQVDSKFYKESLLNCLERNPSLLNSLTAIHFEKKQNFGEEPLDQRLARFVFEKATRLKRVVSLVQFTDSDAIFANLQINAPLEYLMIKNVSDSSFEAIIKLTKTLQILNLAGSNKITTDGKLIILALSLLNYTTIVNYFTFLNKIYNLLFKCKGACRLINEMKSLTKLTVSHCPNIDNRLLKTAIATNRCIDIYCRKTSVKPKKFIEEYPNTYKEDCSFAVLLCSKAGCRYDCDNLSFWS